MTERRPPFRRPSGPDKSHPGTASAVPALLLGVVSIAFQLILMREFVAVFAGNELTIGILLAAWLFWGGLGSLAASRWKYTIRRLAGTFYSALFLAPLALMALRLSRFILGKTPGEAMGFSAALIFAFSLSMLVSFPMGILFVFNIRFLEGNLTRVYIMESLGAFLSGGILYLILIPHLPNWSSAAVVGSLSAAAFFLSLKRSPTALVGILLSFTLLAALDLPSQRLDWKPYRLIRSVDSEYGKLQVLQMAELTHIYSNHHRILTIPDPESAEEAVHFALLQNPTAEHVLLIGGAPEGGVREALKYPRTRVDTVEMDPKASRLARSYMNGQGDRDRVRAFFSDGRTFLKKTGGGEYDMIICNIPEPSTAQLNRYYTREFFLLCRSRMKPAGVFAFRIPSAENYISPPLQRLLSSLYLTLGSVFPRVEIIPGATNIFLSSDRPLILDPEVLAERLNKTGIQTHFVRPELFFTRLSPQRRQSLKESVTSGSLFPALNSDLKPISFLYHSILWSTQFHSLESRFYKALLDLPRFWLMDFPLLLFISFLITLGFFKRKTALTLVPLAVLGLTTVVAELVVLILFQINCGSLYSQISLLFTAFMGGLLLGSLEARRRSPRHSHLVYLQAGFIGLLGAMRLLIPLSLPAGIHPLFLGLLGFLGGELFITTNRLYLNQKENPGLGYALDLLGSFLGALAAASILLPLFGLLSLVDFLLILNLSVLIFVLAGRRFSAAD
jgi:spermidine synthase